MGLVVSWWFQQGPLKIFVEPPPFFKSLFLRRTTMAERKTTKPADEMLEEVTEVEQEITEETNGADNTFTAEVMGEERTFVNHIAGKRPAELMMLSNDRIAMKVMPSLMEKILGEEMFDQILAEGAEIDDLTAILNAWGDTVKGKGSSSRK